MFGNHYSAIVALCQSRKQMTQSDAQGYVDARGEWVLEECKKGASIEDVYSKLDMAPLGMLEIHNEWLLTAK